MYIWLFSTSGSAGTEFKSNKRQTREDDDVDENIGGKHSKADDMESLPVKVLVQPWLFEAYLH